MNIFIKEDHDLDSNKGCTIRYVGNCESCSKKMERTLGNIKKIIKKYDKLLCRSCMLKFQYDNNIREPAHDQKFWKQQKGKKIEEIFGQDKATLIKDKMSNSLSGKNNPMYGKTYHIHGILENNKKRKGKTNLEIYGEEKSLEISKKISKSCSGENNPMYGKPSPTGSGNGWSGWYYEQYFRSIMELSYLVYLKKNEIKYESGENKKYKITYVDEDGNLKNYFPDFYLVDYDMMIEIKPKKLLNTIKNKIKFAKAKEQYGKNFKILTEENITILSDSDIISLYETGNLVFIDRYHKKFLERYLNDNHS